MSIAHQPVNQPLCIISIVSADIPIHLILVSQLAGFGCEESRSGGLVPPETRDVEREGRGKVRWPVLLTSDFEALSWDYQVQGAELIEHPPRLLQLKLFVREREKVIIWEQKER